MPTTRLNLFTNHSRSWQGGQYVYPVISRRSKGLSVGVNLNPDKVCNFDCIYCCVDRSKPPTTTEVDMRRLRAELDHALIFCATGEIFHRPPFDQTPPDLRHINDVAFSGDGEPTSFPQFPDACRLAADLLARHALRHTKIVVITNATLLHRPAVTAALEFLDTHNGEIWAKLDAGTEAYYRLVDRTSIPLRRVLDNIAAAGIRRPIVIQSLFMRIHDQPPPDDEIAAYLERLRTLTANGCRIKLVQVYTTARWTTESYVTPLADTEVDAIVATVTALGIPAEGFYGPA
ncbi:MAG: radical SAM protein [Tepidisphaeraceae bacterium]|jgi:wyosine [tRNA(Phe)-imidazoG37] synthetase (radical SAM superfamily)